MNGKVVCLTGADGGIGRAITKLFAAAGAEMILCSLAPSESYNAFLDELKAQYGDKFHPIYFDLSEEDTIKAAA